MTQSEVSIVFLDRDGTLNVDYGYVCDPSKVDLIHGAAESVARLKRAGLVVIIITNQSAIGRGMASSVEVETTNARLCELLRNEDRDAVIDAVFYCPHAPKDMCQCRKPNTGLLDEVEKKWKIIPERCWAVGDKLTDLFFGERAGIPASQQVLVLTGEGEEQLAQVDDRGALVFCSSIVEAVDFILEKASAIGSVD